MFTIDKLNAATDSFKRYVEPQLYDSNLFDPNSSYVIVCEGDNDDLKTQLDRYAGIDMVTIDNQSQTVQGIASRVQTGMCYRTFTIRAITDNGSIDTELKKRSLAIRNGDMYPTWTIQAYICNNALDNTKVDCTVGVVRTIDLFNYILDQITKVEGIHHTDALIDILRHRFNIGSIGVRNNPYGAVFLTCDWDLLIASGVDVRILQDTFDK